MTHLRKCFLNNNANNFCCRQIVETNTSKLLRAQLLNCTNVQKCDARSDLTVFLPEYSWHTSTKNYGRLWCRDKPTIWSFIYGTSVYLRETNSSKIPINVVLTFSSCFDLRLSFSINFYNLICTTPTVQSFKR